MVRSFFGVRWVKDPALSLKWLRPVLGCVINPWHRNIHRLRACPPPPHKKSTVDDNSKPLSGEEKRKTVYNSQPPPDTTMFKVSNALLIADSFKLGINPLFKLNLILGRLN